MAVPAPAPVPAAVSVAAEQPLQPALGRSPSPSLTGGHFIPQFVATPFGVGRVLPRVANGTGFVRVALPFGTGYIHPLDVKVVPAPPPPAALPKPQSYCGRAYRRTGEWVETPFGIGEVQERRNTVSETSSVGTGASAAKADGFLVVWYPFGLGFIHPADAVRLGAPPSAAASSASKLRGPSSSSSSSPVRFALPDGSASSSSASPSQLARSYSPTRHRSTSPLRQAPSSAASSSGSASAAADKQRAELAALLSSVTALQKQAAAHLAGHPATSHATALARERHSAASDVVGRMARSLAATITSGGIVSDTSLAAFAAAVRDFKTASQELIGANAAASGSTPAAGMTPDVRSAARGDVRDHFAAGKSTVPPLALFTTPGPSAVPSSALKAAPSSVLAVAGTPSAAAARRGVPPQSAAQQQQPQPSSSVAMGPRSAYLWAQLYGSKQPQSQPQQQPARPQVSVASSVPASAAAAVASIRLPSPTRRRAQGMLQQQPAAPIAPAAAASAVVQAQLALQLRYDIAAITPSPAPRSAAGSGKVPLDGSFVFSSGGGDASGTGIRRDLGTPLSLPISSPQPATTQAAAAAASATAPATPASAGGAPASFDAVNDSMLALPAMTPAPARQVEAQTPSTTLAAAAAEGRKASRASQHSQNLASPSSPAAADASVLVQPSHSPSSSAAAALASPLPIMTSPVTRTFRRNPAPALAHLEPRGALAAMGATTVPAAAVTSSAGASAPKGAAGVIQQQELRDRQLVSQSSYLALHAAAKQRAADVSGGTSRRSLAGPAVKPLAFPVSQSSTVSASSPAQVMRSSIGTADRGSSGAEFYEEGGDDISVVDEAPVVMSQQRANARRTSPRPAARSVAVAAAGVGAFPLLPQTPAAAAAAVATGRGGAPHSIATGGSAYSAMSRRQQQAGMMTSSPRFTASGASPPQQQQVQRPVLQAPAAVVTSGASRESRVSTVHWSPSLGPPTSSTAPSASVGGSPTAAAAAAAAAGGVVPGGGVAIPQGFVSSMMGSGGAPSPSSFAPSAARRPDGTYFVVVPSPERNGGAGSGAVSGSGGSPGYGSASSGSSRAPMSPSGYGQARTTSAAASSGEPYLRVAPPAAALMSDAYFGGGSGGYGGANKEPVILMSPARSVLAQAAASRSGFVASGYSGAAGSGAAGLQLGASPRRSSSPRRLTPGGGR